MDDTNRSVRRIAQAHQQSRHDRVLTIMAICDPAHYIFESACTDQIRGEPRWARACGFLQTGNASWENIAATGKRCHRGQNHRPDYDPGL